MTELQKFLKTLRIIHEENLQDMAKNIGVSASFLSAIEHGKKAVPPKLEDIIVEKYNLEKHKQLAFNKLCGASRKTIILKAKTERSRKILAFIAKEIDNLDPNQIVAIEKILKKEYKKKEKTVAESFNARIKRAIAFIKSGRRSNRSFDSIFENYDGDYIVTAIYRASHSDTKLKENMYKYIGKESTERAAKDLVNISDHELPKEANAYRKRCVEESRKMIEGLSDGSPAISS